MPHQPQLDLGTLSRPPAVTRPDHFYVAIRVWGSAGYLVGERFPPTGAGRHAFIWAGIPGSYLPWFCFFRRAKSADNRN